MVAGGLGGGAPETDNQPPQSLSRRPEQDDAPKRDAYKIKKADEVEIEERHHSDTPTTVLTTPSSQLRHDFP
jgi:hypothetical protein